MMGKIDEALRLFGRVQEATKDPGIIDEVAVACGLLSEHLRTEQRWLESGLCAKFLFENLTTPLLETSHMFGRYGGRLLDAGLYEEEYQAVTKLGIAIADRTGDPDQMRIAKLRRAKAALRTERIDKAKKIIGELEQEAREQANRSLELSLLGFRAELELSQGEYQAAFDLVKSFAGTDEEEAGLRDAAWGNTLADIRACSCILLGRMEDALDDLDAGRISAGASTLRMVLAAELIRRGSKAAALACLQSIEAQAPPRQEKFLGLASAALRGEALVEALQELVETSLQPGVQPRGLFFAGLALWSAGNDGAATLPWSDAVNSAPPVSPIWHWANYFQGRVET
jgi:hypothetical protein